MRIHSSSDRGYDVYLNGVEQKRVIMADDELGVIEVSETPAKCDEYGFPLTCFKYGFVEIKKQESEKADEISWEYFSFQDEV